MWASPDFAYLTSGALIGSRFHREDSPLIGDTFQCVLAAILELESRSGHDALHSLGHEHFSRFREVADARCDVDGDAADVGAHHLDPAGVQTDTRIASNCPTRLH